VLHHQGLGIFVCFKQEGKTSKQKITMGISSAQPIRIIEFGQIQLSKKIHRNLLAAT
jgi:hypothetical protein